MPDGIDFNALYKAIAATETDNKVKDPTDIYNKKRFIRTDVDTRPTHGVGSSAYGPLQITHKLAKQYAKTGGEDFKKLGIEEYVPEFLEQGAQFLHARNDDPVYGLSKPGVLSDRPEEYAKFATYLLQKEQEEVAKKLKTDDPKALITGTVARWRGEADPKYHDKFWNYYNQFKETKPAVAPTLEEFSKRYKAPQQKKADLITNQTGSAQTPDFQTEAIKAKLASVATKPDSERASIGAKIGAILGAGVGGDMGMLVGSQLGAFATRAFGQLADGKVKKNQERLSFADYIATTGIADKLGNMSFSDGVSFNMLPDAEQLPNTSAVVSGKKVRDKYEIDKSNPLTNRTLSVATPIAAVLSTAIKNRSGDTLLDTRNILTNALQKDATSISDVYKRAVELVSKSKITREQMLQYFEMLKPTMTEEQQAQYMDGMVKIYGN